MITYIKILKKDGDTPWEGTLADFEKEFFRFRVKRDDFYIQSNIMQWCASMGWRQLDIHFG